MKKKLLVLLFSMLAFCAFAEETVRSVIVVPFPIGLGDTEKVWLVDLVKDRLEADIRTYTDYKLITSNVDSVKNLQKKFENAAYDESSAIELGKLTTASHAINMKLTKTGSGYVPALELVNLSTGMVDSKCTGSSKRNTEELYNGDGCGIDLLMLDFCDKARIPLSSLQRLSLKGQLNDLNDDEKYQQEISDWQKQISAYDSEIKSLSKSADLSSVAQKQKAEAARKMAEGKLKAAQDNQKRALEDLDRKNKEKLINASKKAEQQERIVKTANQAEKKVRELRNAKLSSESVVNQIRIIEAQKKALLEIRADVDNELNNIAQKYNSEYQAKIAEIDNKPFRDAETDKNGNPTEGALKIREKKKEDIKRNLDQEWNKEKNILTKSVQNQDNELRKIIDENYKLLSKKKPLNSILGNVQLSFSRYDGERNLWNVTVGVYIEGQLFRTIQSVITYEQITGNKPVDIEKVSPEQWDAFCDQIDLYDSLFKLSEPVVIAQTYVSAQPCDDKEPSKYIFQFEDVEFYKIENISVSKDGVISGKSIGKTSILPANNRITYASVPAYDIRTKAEVQQDELKQKQQEEQVQKIAEVKQKRQQRKIEREFADYSWADQRLGNGRRGFIGADIGGGIAGSTNGFAGDINIAIPASTYAFYSATVGVQNYSSATDRTYYLHNVTKPFSFAVNAGFNKAINIGFINPIVYLAAGLGANFVNIPRSTGEKSDVVCEGFFRVTGGVEYPFTKHLSVLGEYRFDYDGFGPSHKLLVGVGYAFHEGKKR